MALRDRASGRDAGMSGRAGVAMLLLAAASVAPAQSLTPQAVFRQVAPSVVVIEVVGKNEKVVATGSGVVIPSRDAEGDLIATNCHVTDQADSIVGIRQGETIGVGYVTNRDAARDLCIVEALVTGEFDANTGKLVPKKLPAAQVASSQRLQVGDTVYAVGAPQGLELSLSDGLVSGFRQHRGTDYIQTTAPISKGSSGGGLFDAQGRLVGITTMYLKDAQALNFAVPAEAIASVPAIGPAVQAAARRAEPEPQRKDRWWTFYEDDKQKIAFDTETVDRDGRKVTVWERTTYANPRHSTGKSYVEDIARATYYCNSRKHSFDQFTWRDASGKVVYSRTLKSYEVEIQDVMPQTIGEAKYEAACDD